MLYSQHNTLTLVHVYESISAQQLPVGEQLLGLDVTSHPMHTTYTCTQHYLPEIHHTTERPEKMKVAMVTSALRKREASMVISTADLLLSH